MKKNYPLNSNDRLTQLVKSKEIESWNELIEFIKNLPYGRNSNRIDFGLVISERKGTCSSKHAVLKHIADLNHIPNVDLIIGMYRMNELNTPKIGTELTNKSIEFIPEAHCYLQINGRRIDLTTPESTFSKIENDILQEIKIAPEQVGQYKVEFHKNFVKEWLIKTKSTFEFEQIWEIREKCIANLTDKEKIH